MIVAAGGSIGVKRGSFVYREVQTQLGSRALLALSAPKGVQNIMCEAINVVICRMVLIITARPLHDGWQLILMESDLANTHP